MTYTYNNGKELRINCRRRRRGTLVGVYVVTLALLTIIPSIDAFGFRSITKRLRPNRIPDSERYSNNLDNNVDSWSKSASGRKSSPLQVRKRVKAVLQKARSRTGVENKSVPSEASIVAEAASIGGFAEDIRIDIKKTLEESSNGKALPEVNGSNAEENETTTVRALPTFADENLDVQKINGVEMTEDRKRKPEAFDVVRGDMPAANEFCEPIPFQLPTLTAEQKALLVKGERVQEQARMGREGSGYVVLDVQAPPYVVWECLLDFESYPQTIPTVRDMQLYTSEKLNTGYVNEKPVLPGTGRETRHYGTPSVTRAKFILSKFRLNIAAVHTYTPHPDGDYMIFTLDKSCTNMVLKGAKGIWYTEENPDGREGYTRVYLLCEVLVSRALPSFIVDYTADRAMPRATNWLKPQVEAAADLWLKTPR
mmetsp:Transcript_43010/g.104121  ORF Transcript_43010/g.104121 Transcript_43010/m.104121 type:complete len:425 (-) Transcript_43010:271-1545(-)|eukprot:CAMPEP_0113629102 /NCGR_PEP_ID=MMETSP0017_2-20120614/15098_1 /TAXON_ID=2856 /ORGANISM="Cylindrotheca closterium" /LENGTH=424 /DNA_ID=CAMNT_0000539469 /DNA_START=71 /DNA_END=1345 /DNA_ORIENTATION=+ /assembly_acc=CAM_ASM_000147